MWTNAIPVQYLHSCFLCWCFGYRMMLINVFIQLILWLWTIYYQSWILICMHTYTGSTQPFPLLPLKYLYACFSDSSPHGEMFHQDLLPLYLKPPFQNNVCQCQLFGTAEKLWAATPINELVLSWFPSWPSPPPFPLGHLLHICSAHLLMVAMVAVWLLYGCYTQPPFC